MMNQERKNKNGFSLNRKISTSKSKKGKTFSNQKFSFPRDNLKSAEFSSTLLIPDEHFKIFQKRISELKGVREYVAYLLEKYQVHIANGLVPGYSRVTTKYQEKDLNLHKVAFRPRPEDWVELKLYRVAFGMSISAFLVYLLIADSVEFAKAVSNYLESVGVSILPEFDLSAKVYLCNKKSNYTIIFQYRKGKDH